MFGRTSSGVVEPLASVSSVSEVLAQLRTHQDELARFHDGLSSATQETERLTREEQEQRDAMYRHAARALVNPDEQQDAERCHARAQACKDRLADLRRQIAAFNGEIQRAETAVERLRSELSRARRTAWEDIFQRLANQFGEEQREHFLKLWTAFDALYNGAPAVAVLQRLGLAELETDTKLQMIDKLCETYGMPKH